MSILDVRDLRKSMGTRTLLDGVSLTIDQGVRIGLVGANGCGKSTLARILASIDTPDGGELAKRRDAKVVYLAQEPSFDGDPSALEAVLSGLGSWSEARSRHRRASEELESGSDTAHWLKELESAAQEMERLGGWTREHEARAVLSHLGIVATDRQVGTMSGGERRRVALARVLVSAPDLAILDEPTNHLDVETIEWLESYLSTSFGGAVLLVTHDRWFLNHVVSRTLELERGQLHSYDGGWEEYLEAKADRQALEHRTEKNRQNLLRRELEWLRRTPAARTGKQKARIDRAEQTIAARGPTRTRDVQLAMESVRSGRTILDLHDVVLRVGDRVLVDDLTLSLTKGERMGIVGPNGAGKSTLLRAITGEIEASAGQVVRGTNTKIAYLDQHRSGLSEDASVADNVSPHSSKVEWGGRTIELVSYLERMLFDSQQQKQPVSALSGGERARVLIARMLLESANLLILDEPTNDLDAPTLAALEEMLTEFEGTAIVVTHDRWFLERVATSILAFEGNGKVRRWAGNYSVWRTLSREEAAQKASEPIAPKLASQDTRTKAVKSGLSQKEKRELEGLMARIEAAEADVAQRERELADPAFYVTRSAESPALLAELAAKRDEITAMMARWEELETRNGSA